MSRRFQQGQFLGDRRRERSIGSLRLSELVPTVPEPEVERHTHSDGHFLLLLGGRYLSEAEGMPPLCTQQVLIGNPPGTTHRDRFQDLDGAFLTLSMPQADWDALPGGSPLHERAMRLGTAALLAGHRLRAELRRWQPESALAVQSEHRLLQAELLMQLRRLQDPGLGPAWLRRARERLEDGGAAVPSLDSLAAEADLHPVYFARAFRRRYGASPGAYLRRYRLERAAALLDRSRLPLARIALDCGYCDQSHFSHAFHDAFGLSPRAFRRLLRDGGR